MSQPPTFPPKKLPGEVDAAPRAETPGTPAPSPAPRFPASVVPAAPAPTPQTQTAPTSRFGAPTAPQSTTGSRFGAPASPQMPPSNRFGAPATPAGGGAPSWQPAPRPTPGTDQGRSPRPAAGQTAAPSAMGQHRPWQSPGGHTPQGQTLPRSPLGQTSPRTPAAAQSPFSGGTGQRFTGFPKADTDVRPPTSPLGGATRPATGFAPAGSPLNSPTSPSSAFRPAGSTLPGTPRATSPFRKDLQISDEEFLQLRDFIYLQCGIFIAENRKYLVENRLSNRIKDLNLKSYGEYYNYLRFDANRRTELNKLFEVVTTNETSFFRNPPQLEVFQKNVLPEILDRQRKTGHKRLRIWSAGCSTGEEPYTLAIILHEVLKGEVAAWDIKITANDLSSAVLAAARRGVYNEYALRTTPKEITGAYFSKEGALYRIKPELQRMVAFGQINLNDKEQLRRVEKSQIVFCRNVIIYFDDEMKRKVINAFYDNLELNGALLIGHSESLHNISRAFHLEHYKGTIVYRKLS